MRWSEKFPRKAVRSVQPEFLLSLVPGNPRATLRSVLGHQQIAQVFKVLDSLAEPGYLGG